jgi:hypothetical protein
VKTRTSFHPDPRDEAPLLLALMCVNELRDPRTILIAGVQFSLERIDPMAKNSVYRIIDVVGVSETSWEEAGRNAVETAAGSLHDLRVAEVTKMDMKVENGKVTEFRTRVALSFKYEV